jgi:steroid delta-isomerase
MVDQSYSDNAKFLADCKRIYGQWHDCAKARNLEGLLALYAHNAVLETPLVQAVYPGRADGVLRGHHDISDCFAEAISRPLNKLVRWYRTGRWLTDGERVVAWEYPRATPGGDQVDLVELMEIESGLIQAHRVYGGWLGTSLLARSRTLI